MVLIFLTVSLFYYEGDGSLRKLIWAQSCNSSAIWEAEARKLSCD